MRTRTIWPFGVNFLLFAGYASVGPFFVLYYQGLGFTGAQIGLLTGLAPLITFCSAPLWTRFADRTLQHRLMMSLALLGGVAVLSIFPLLHAFAPIMGLAILLNIFLAPITAFTDSATMIMLGERKAMYGRIRIGGTIGYGLAASIAGVLVQKYGISSAFWTCASLFVVALLASQKLTHSQSRAAGISKGSFRTLLANPRWPLFLAIAFAGGLSLASFNYLFSYMRELGANESIMGVALAMGTIVEIPVLFFANRLINRFTARSVLMMAAAASGIRLLLFAASGGPSWILAIQLLNGITFPLMWVAGVSYANTHAPQSMSATAQGLFGAAVYGFGMAVGGFIGGPLLEDVGGRGLHLIFGGIVLAIVALVALIERRLPAEQVTSSNGVME